MNTLDKPDLKLTNILVGVLVDVSGSMKCNFQKDVEPTDDEYSRAESVFKTIIKIAEDEFTYNDRQEIQIGYEPLIKLAAEYGAPHAEKYIRKYIKTEEEAGFLYDYYSSKENSDKLKTIIDGLPEYCKKSMTGFASRKTVGAVEVATSFFANNYVEKKEMTLATKHIKDALEKANFSSYSSNKKLLKDIDIERDKKSDKEELLEELKARRHVKPKIKTFKSTIDLLHKVTDKKLSSTTTKSFSVQQIKELVSSIEPYIYGGTPMCEALMSGLRVFDSSNCDTKVLFLLTDGEAADGNPVKFAKDFHTINVCVFVCLITPENIQNPRQLFGEAQPNWTKPQKDMFNMCSTIENTHSAMSILLEQGWQLPPDGESRLFLQANNPDVIDEFAKTVRRFAENTNALLNIFGRVLLDQYINTKMSGFKAPEQVGGTCYANAVAAVLHMAMSRIVGRIGGVPEFEVLRQEIIEAFGEDGANTASVLAKWTSKYRMHCEKVDELKAKQALNARRPVVARFKLFDEEWDQFGEFYDKNPKGILTRNDLVTNKPLTNPGGHAVVLMKCDPQGLTLMNSWGNEWADNGFFKVQNQAVLNLEFFDVYWTLNDLYPEEIDSFNKSKRNVAEDIVRKLPLSVQNLPFKCPQCSKSSSASSFIGHLLEATCPKCRQNFKPTPLGFVLNW